MAKKTDRHVSNDGKTRPLKNYLRILEILERAVKTIRTSDRRYRNDPKMPRQRVPSIRLFMHAFDGTF
jgi:hypothetical protein